MKKYNITKDFLIKEYSKNEKSSNNIAKGLGCSKIPVLMALKEYNIPIRNRSECQKTLQYKRKKYYCIDCDKEICYKTWKYGTKRCVKCAMKEYGKNHTGKNNGNYIDGKGNTPYPLEFNEELKLKIRQRDNYQCQNCGITEEEYLIIFGRVLDIHHIDYNKSNCNKNNLITLCNQCNIRANYNRDYWISELRRKISWVSIG